MSGFSLVELIAGVLIVAVLAVMTLTGAQMLRENSRNIRCIQHLKQSGQAILLCVGEGTTFETFAGGSNTQIRIWGDLLYSRRYLLDREAARCPSATSAHPIDNLNWYWSSFGFYMPESENAFRSHDQPKATGFSFNLSRLPLHSQRILLADSIDPRSGHQTFRIKTENPVVAAFDLRHRRRANAFFVDGHVEALGREELVQRDIPESQIYPREE